MKRKGLNLDEFTLTNTMRCENVFHPIKEWTPTDWATAAAGELGEACNLIKKARRTNYKNLVMERVSIAYELADAITYIDLLCTRLGIDLTTALVEKFNIVSRRVGSSIYLEEPTE